MRIKEFYGHTVTEKGEFINDRGRSISVRRSGPLNIILKNNGFRKSFMVGRVLYYLFVEEFDMNDKNILVGFKDGNIRNAELSNLYLMDRKGLPINNIKFNEIVSDKTVTIEKINRNLNSLDIEVDYIEEDENIDMEEGEHIKRIINSKKRNANARKLKLEQCKKDNGNIFCEICKENDIVALDVHHDLVQVANMKKGHKTKLSDLRLICANCHRKVHGHNKTVDELIKVYSSNHAL